MSRLVFLLEGFVRRPVAFGRNTNRPRCPAARRRYKKGLTHSGTLNHQPWSPSRQTRPHQSKPSFRSLLREKPPSCPCRGYRAVCRLSKGHRSAPLLRIRRTLPPSRKAAGRQSQQGSRPRSRQVNRPPKRAQATSLPVPVWPRSQAWPKKAKES